MWFDAPFVVVPGNHDIERQKMTKGDAVWQWYERALQSEKTPQGSRDTAFHTNFRNRPTQAPDPVSPSLANYAQWWNTCPQTAATKAKLTTGLLPGDGTITLQGDAIAVQLACINTTYLHAVGGKAALAMFGKPELYGQLEWHPVQPIPSSDLITWAATQQPQPTLLMGHHPPDWMYRPDPPPPTCPVRGRGVIDLHFCGHVHYGQLTSDNYGANVLLWIAESLAGEPPTAGPSTPSPGTPDYLRHGFAVGQIMPSPYNTSAGMILRRWSRSALSIALGKDRSMSPTFEVPSDKPNPMPYYECPLQAGRIGAINPVDFFNETWELQALQCVQSPTLLPPTGGSP